MLMAVEQMTGISSSCVRVVKDWFVISFSEGDVGQWSGVAVPLGYGDRRVLWHIRTGCCVTGSGIPALFTTRRHGSLWLPCPPGPPSCVGIYVVMSGINHARIILGEAAAPETRRERTGWLGSVVWNSVCIAACCLVGNMVCICLTGEWRGSVTARSL